MKSKFESIDKAVSPFEHFDLKWRFTDEKYNLLPANDLREILPLNEKGTTSLETLIHELGIRKQYELNKEYFDSIVQLPIRTKSKKQITIWLDNIEIANDTQIYLLWDSWGSVITKWGILKEYYDDFFYPTSDDITIVDASLNWALYFFHDEIIYYGMRKSSLNNQKQENSRR